MSSPFWSASSSSFFSLSLSLSLGEDLGLTPFIFFLLFWDVGYCLSLDTYVLYVIGEEVILSSEEESCCAATPPRTRRYRGRRRGGGGGGGGIDGIVVALPPLPAETPSLSEEKDECFLLMLFKITVTTITTITTTSRKCSICLPP